MASYRAAACAAMLFANVLMPAAAGSAGFLDSQRRASTIEDFQAAMGTVLGCGGTLARERLNAVEQILTPMWQVLPKNEHGLVEWRMVRYLAHRYFTQQSSLMVRGFEPMRQINASNLGTPDIFGEQVPSVVQTAIDGKHTSNGFSLDDAAAMVLTLEQLISDSESTLLEKVYKQQRKSSKERLDHAELSRVMEAYMVHWMMDGDDASIAVVLRNRTLLEEAFPKWHDIRDFVAGEVRSVEFQRQRAPRPGHGKAALAGQFSFEEAHQAVGGFTKRFASFWENECQAIKHSLVAFDKTGTGRVSLSDFYGANADGEWRFGESEQYLRELGALDESNQWLGKQVIISNYVQGASNCILTTPHYLVCCQSECESVLNDIEQAVGSPVAQPEVILSLVGNLTDLDDVPPPLSAKLRTQLERIAETHGGSVPLHGRLFAQWLHYVFPRECPFPHKVGAAAVLTPTQYGSSFIASDEEVSSHAAARNQSSQQLGALEDAQMMSQWSEEEELIADYSMHLRAPWETGSGMAMLFTLFFVLALVATAVIGGGGSDKAAKPTLSSPMDKPHFV